MRRVIPHVGWAVFLYSVGLTGTFVWVGSLGSWICATCFAALSIVHVLCDAEDKEGRSFIEILTPRGNSKAFTLGDYGLLMAIGFMASVWSVDEARDDELVLYSVLVGAAAGTIASILLRIFDRQRYVWEKALHLFYRSPTKLGHDFTVALALVPMLATLSIPLFLQWHGQTIPAAVGVLWWVMCGVYDFKNPPNPHHQHALDKNENQIS